MFRIKSSFKDKIEIQPPLPVVRNFFSKLTNFTDMLPGVESIRRETAGVMRWTITTDTPVGNVRFSFPVRETSPDPHTIEWSPALNEDQNLLRYSLRLEDQNGASVDDASHPVGLRRKHAWG